MKLGPIIACTAVWCCWACHILHAVQYDDSLEQPALTLAGPITQISFCEDRSQVLIIAHNTVHQKSWPGLEPVSTKSFDCGQVVCATFDQTETRLYAACSKPGEFGSVVCVDWSSGREEQSWQVHDDAISALALSPDGLFCATASYDHTIAVIDLQTGQAKTLTGHSRPVRDLVWIDNNRLVSAGEDHSLRVWDMLTGNIERVAEQHTGAVVGLLPLSSTTGEKLIVSFGQDRTVRLWQPARGRMVRFVRLQSQPLCAIWSGDGSEILVGDDRGSVHTIDIATAKLIGHRKVCNDWIESLARCPATGKILAGTNRGELYVIASEL